MNEARLRGRLAGNEWLMQPRYHPINEMAAFLQARDKSLFEKRLLVELLSRYSMGSAVTATLQTRMNSLDGPLNDLIATMHGRSYFGEVKIAELRKRLAELIQTRVELDTVNRVTSDDFSLNDWLGRKGSWKTDR